MFSINQFIERSSNRKKCDEVKQYGRMVLYRMRGQKSNKNNCETIQMYPHQSTFNPRQRSMLTTNQTQNKNDSFPPSFGKPKVARSIWRRRPANFPQAHYINENVT